MGLTRSGATSRRPHARILELERRLTDAQIRIVQLEALAKAAGLNLAGLTPEWARDLSPSETAALMALVNAYPRPLSVYDLDEVVPRYDHVEDRDVRGMGVLIHKIRKKIGHGAIRNLWGRGYVLSPEFKAIATKSEA